MLMFVIVFVVRPPITEAHLTRQAGLCQKSERPIHSRLAHRGILLAHQTVEVLTRDVVFSAQEHVENKIALGRALQTLLLNEDLYRLVREQDPTVGQTTV